MTTAVGTAAPVGAAKDGDGYRADLDGLRGIAILLVVVGHVWFGRVSGGVDAFLLLAGFFVGASLLRRASTGRIALVSFTGKVARRFLPVIVPVVAAVLVGAVFVYPPTRWSDIAEQAISSTFMFENWWLAVQGTAYGGADVDASPFQHLWSLSVQAQLYLGLAVVLAIVAAALHTLRVRARPVLYALIVVLAIASFCYAAIQVDRDPVWAYFDTAARAWEVLLGIIAAVAFRRTNLPERWRVVLGWLGLIMLLSTMWVVDGAQSFPGPAALLPLGGTLLIIVAGTTPTTHGVDAFLRTRPSRALGGTAFGLYAWHWPVLVFFLAVTGRDRVGLIGGLAIIATSLALAFASLRFVERPFRLPRPSRIATAILVAGVIVVAAVPFAWLQQATRLVGASQRATADGGSQEVAPDGGWVPQLADVLAAEVDAPRIYPDKCIARGRDVDTCTYGEGARTLALVGGSHSGQWFEPLRLLALEKGFRLVTYLRDGCYFGQPGLDLYLSDDCDAWNAAVADRLVQDDVDAVFTTATRSNRFDGRQTEWVPRGYRESWAQLSAVGIPVVAIRDTPWLGENPLDCLSGGGDVASCGTDRSDFLLAVNPIESATLPDGVVPIDLSDEICPDAFCPAVSDDLIVYRDDNHLTSSYAVTLTIPLGEQLGRATGWWD
jgi:peptidoglycan/LPS O-acetylase OafA/YrhL